MLSPQDASQLLNAVRTGAPRLEGHLTGPEQQENFSKGWHAAMSYMFVQLQKISVIDLQSIDDDGHIVPHPANKFNLNETYYIGDSLSLWAYRGIETNMSGSDLYVFQCVEFDSEDEFEYYSVENELSWIKPSSAGIPAVAEG